MSNRKYIVIFSLATCLLFVNVLLSLRSNKCEIIHVTKIRSIGFATEFDLILKSDFRRSVDERWDSRSLALTDLVSRFIDHPANDASIKIHKTQIFSTPQSEAVDKILKQKTKGFFVECGAFDGETASNTLFLEQKRHWRGVLIEMDPFLYTQVLGKNRRVAMMNVCLSPEGHATEIPFIESTAQLGQLILNDTIFRRQHAYRSAAPCFPLETIILALQEKRIDYFSLDVEGYELEVLKSIPFDRLDISVLSVEYKHVKAGKEAVRTFMEGKGYRVQEDISFVNLPRSVFVDDFIFVKKGLQV